MSELTSELTVTSPYDGAVVEHVPTQDLAFVQAALAQAQASHRDRSAWLPKPQRIEILQATAELMRDSREDLARLIAAEGGKPLQDARVEVSRAIDGVAMSANLLAREAGDVVPMGMDGFTTGRAAYTHKEPIGPVVAVSAFNHPLNLIVHQVAPAVAAGCPVIVKPSEDTPLCCLRFVDLLRRAGLPEAWCVPVVTQDLAVAEALVTDPRVGFFSFIGSARVGWMLRSKLAPGVRCALEHGGAAPLIVAEDADREAALAAILKGGFYHAGQVCVSVQRVFVPRGQLEGFAAMLAERAAALVVGDPLKADTEVGPLIRPREVARVGEWVHAAVAAGARCLTGGHPLSERCYAPTVLLDPPAAARVSQEEIFGPVVCLYGYDDLDACIAQANSLPVAFQAAVFTQSIDTATTIATRLDASAVMINDHTAFRTDGMPFAGLRESGLGVGGIPHTFEDMQIDKMLVWRSPGL